MVNILKWKDWLLPAVTKVLWSSFGNVRDYVFEAHCFPEEATEVIARPLGLRWQTGLSPLSLGQLEPGENGSTMCISWV